MSRLRQTGTRCQTLMPPSEMLGRLTFKSREEGLKSNLEVQPSRTELAQHGLRAVRPARLVNGWWSMVLMGGLPEALVDALVPRPRLGPVPLRSMMMCTLILNAIWQVWGVASLWIGGQVR
jgi:hypothetical protein